ncbi:MAG: RNA polymerase sigma factor [Eubacterium sp.]
MLAFYMSFIDDEDDRDKFEIIYYKYRKRMLLIADSVVHNKQDAEDVVHDTFIKIARNMKSVGEPDSDMTLSYVLKATKNTAINLYNKNKQYDNIANDEIIENIPDGQFFERLNITENYNAVVDAILELDDVYKDVMFYHFVQEMKIGEIADLLGRKKSTVKQQLVRGKKILLEILEKE